MKKMKTDPMKPIADMLDEIQGRADAAATAEGDTVDEWGNLVDAKEDAINRSYPDVPKLVEGLRFSKSILEEIVTDTPCMRRLGCLHCKVSLRLKTLQAILSKP